MTDSHKPTRTAVIGSGYMGGGIAQVLAMAGHPVALADVDAQTAARSRERLVGEAQHYEELGLFCAGSVTRVQENLTASESVESAVAQAEYITEAVPETLEIKLNILRRISKAALPEAIIGTNTSAIPIDDLAGEVLQPGRFLGVHWMNPAPFIPGVELIPSGSTDSATVDFAERFIGSLGKITARVSDTPGFVANRLQFALYKEALAIVEEKTATPHQVDAVVSNTFGFRLALFGPFAIGDMAGLDVYAGAYKTLEKAYGERFAAPALLTSLVEQGRIGIKSGAGILDEIGDGKDALLAYRDKAYAQLAQLRAELGPAPGFG
ncbi:3-hydroxyacyl-CoA dehydrogenase [Rhodococcus sp. Leaf278]|uniref:3-hydroxyacyl-CoA dehydrogenase family protein n=1 Tax=Rhodococcus sp. Leaf278 TaxID=1736319 RepID=UPI00070C26F1|nr:3-hydroxyacyl-CoA dehydrogenase family protein [Rhodococcus sp. Leaf278]KQU50508.1 3-hydroxyacyl-CoA dehydrogenase [Rhodococcus sp. Leaf278]